MSQLAGAVAVATLASIAMLVFPDSVELNATELVLTSFVAVVGYLSMRWSGAGRTKAAGVRRRDADHRIRHRRAEELARRLLSDHQGWMPVSSRKVPLGPPSGSVASSRKIAAPCSGVRVPRWPLRSVAT